MSTVVWEQMILLTYSQVSSSLMLGRDTYVIHLTSLHHVGFLSPHIRAPAAGGHGPSAPGEVRLNSSAANLESGVGEECVTILIPAGWRKGPQ